jgi:predicted Zn-ribbon and HTH transcriptional regulator
VITDTGEMWHGIVDRVNFDDDRLVLRDALAYLRRDTFSPPETTEVKVPSKELYLPRLDAAQVEGRRKRLRANEDPRQTRNFAENADRDDVRGERTAVGEYPVSGRAALLSDSLCRDCGMVTLPWRQRCPECRARWTNQTETLYGTDPREDIRNPDP